MPFLLCLLWSGACALLLFDGYLEQINIRLKLFFEFDATKPPV